MVVLKSLVVLAVTRLGSLNALEQSHHSAFWRRWLGRPLPSADSMGRIASLIDADDLRVLVQRLYTSLKRNKALAPTSHGLMALVIDGHESHATYYRRCSACLERRVKTKRGWRTQFYHRNVTAMLVSRDFPLLLDAEPLQNGEDELEAALRLLRRVLMRFPRAFDVVLGDALYTDPRVYRLLQDHGKDVLTVLKRNAPDLLEDASSLFDATSPQAVVGGALEREIWDQSEFTSWREYGLPVRVIRSRETRAVRRQLDRVKETLLSEWLWVTTLSPHRATTSTVVELGHARWTIENQGFNETVCRWHADHVYRHHPTAILVFWLLTMIAYDLFHAFYHRNLKAACRQRVNYLYLARWLASDLYPALSSSLPRPP